MALLSASAADVLGVVLLLLLLLVGSGGATGGGGGERERGEGERGEGGEQVDVVFRCGEGN